MEANERNLMDTQRLATRLGRSRYWVQTNHKRLGIPSFKIGNSFYFVEPEVETWLETHRFTEVPSEPKLAKVKLFMKAS